MKQPLLYYFLTDDELLRISNRIKKMEKITSGEISVSIKENRTFFQKKKSILKLAEEEFRLLSVINTRDKTGILIFIPLEERQFYILADEGINKKVQPHTWDNIKDKMQEFFISGDFCKGILYGVEEIGNILSINFPVKPGDTNELSNKVFIK